MLLFLFACLCAFLPAPASALDAIDEAQRLSESPIPEPAPPPAFESELAKDAFDQCLAKLDAVPPAPPGPQPPPPPPAQPRWSRLPGLPAINDDLDRKSMAEAARRTAEYWSKRPDATVTVDGRTVTSGQLKPALESLAKLVETVQDPAQLQKELDARFDVYQSLTADGSPQGKVTGYFAPEIPVQDLPCASGVAIHARPNDLAKPYLKGWEILVDGKLPAGLEIACTPHPADLYKLQTEGSGYGVLPDGRKVFLAYSDGNGHPFRSVSTSLHKCGIKPGPLGPDALAAYLKSLPLELERKAVGLNTSYVFFERKESGGPTGATGVELTAGRSIAVDRKMVPLGLPALLSAKGKKEFSRIVFTHDVGGAIQGGARVDLYFGSGPQAEADGDSQNSPGGLCVLVPK